MKYLVDSNVWLWTIGDVARLNRMAREILSDPQNDLYFSAASVWEIAIKYSLGRLQLPESPSSLIPRETERLGIRALPINYHHALAVQGLPLHHGDPFDRVLVAQAQTEGLTLITADREIRRYPVQILWAGR